MDGSSFILPILVIGILSYSWYKKQNAYQSFIQGVKKGLHLFWDIYPSMLAMLLAIQILKMSDLLSMFAQTGSFLFPFVPKAIWPMILFRPISGSASLAILIDLMKTYGADSLIGFMASVIQGSTDTTFYVLALYFGSVGIKNIKNALWIGLLADIAGICMAILLVLLFRL